MSDTFTNDLVDLKNKIIDIIKNMGDGYLVTVLFSTYYNNIKLLPMIDTKENKTSEHVGHGMYSSIIVRHDVHKAYDVSNFIKKYG